MIAEEIQLNQMFAAAVVAGSNEVEAAKAGDKTLGLDHMPDRAQRSTQLSSAKTAGNVSTDTAVVAITSVAARRSSQP